MKIDQLSPEEMAESFVFPVTMSAEEQQKANAELALARQKKAAKRKKESELYGRLLQFKIQLEDYLSQKTYEPERNFGHFLSDYVKLLAKKKKDFAWEINIHETLLSQLLSSKRTPSEDIFVKLELHSKEIIPATDWYRLLSKELEFRLMTDQKLRNEEKKHLKGYAAVESR